jgi:hypothetical protein
MGWEILFDSAPSYGCGVGWADWDDEAHGRLGGTARGSFPTPDWGNVPFRARDFGGLMSTR